MLKQRVLTALCLLIIFLAILFYAPAWTWQIFIAVAVVLAGWEWGGFFHYHSRLRSGFSFVLGLLFVGIACCFSDVKNTSLSLSILYISALFWILIIPFWLKYRWALNHKILQMLVACIVILPLSFSLLLLREKSPWLVLICCGLIWVTDIAAYFSGRKFGRHPLASYISPKKTWEGAVGAVVGVVLYTLLMIYIDQQMNMDWMRLSSPMGILLCEVLIFSVCITAVSIWGDLFESHLKRQAGIKDSGTIFPGHGGILDRIDSMTSTMPILLLLLSYVS